MKGTTYKRCGCRDAAGKLIGKTCPKLRRPGGGWNPTHGVWHLQIELPPRVDGGRRPLRRGGFDSQTDAAAELDRIRQAIAIAVEAAAATAPETDEDHENDVLATLTINYKLNAAEWRLPVLLVMASWRYKQTVH